MLKTAECKYETPISTFLNTHYAENKEKSIWNPKINFSSYTLFWNLPKIRKKFQIQLFWTTGLHGNLRKAHV